MRGQSSNAFQKVVTTSRLLGFFVPAFNTKVSWNFLRVIIGIKAQYLHEIMGRECLAHRRCSINATHSQEVAVNMEGMFATLLPTLVADKGQFSGTGCVQCAQIHLPFLIPCVACKEGGI